MRVLLMRLAVACGVALLVFVGVLLAVLPSQSEARARSVFSLEPTGLRVLFLLCEELGFPVQSWSEAPGRLSGPGTLLVLGDLPPEPPALPPVPAGGDGQDASPRRGRDLAHYRRFVEEGGTLLVLDTAAGAKAGRNDRSRAELAFLRDTLALPDLDDLDELESSLLESRVERNIVLVGDERLVLRNKLRRFLRAVVPAEVLATAEDGSRLVLARPVGAGRVVLGTLPIGWLDNGSLAEDGEPALVLVRCLERLGPLERILFDEYALGGWRPEPVAGLAFSPRLALLSAHVILLFLVLGWRSAWSGPFPRDPGSWLAASPLARARGFGRTLARAGRWDILARQLRRGVLERWDARTGQRVAPGEAADAAPRAEARLRELARGDEDRLAHLFELFLARAPRDEPELAALEADLRAMERELFAAPETRKPRHRPGARRSRSGS